MNDPAALAKANASSSTTAEFEATIDNLSGGRMRCGIGASGPQVAEGWHGQRFARQLQQKGTGHAVQQARLQRGDAARSQQTQRCARASHYLVDIAQAHPDEAIHEAEAQAPARMEKRNPAAPPPVPG